MSDLVPSILITGASGFVGRHLTSCLAGQSYSLRLCSRKQPETAVPTEGEIVSYDLTGDNNDYDQLLVGIDTVIHLAGIVHRRRVKAADYFTGNLHGTAKLAAEAAYRGVRRFVFISTVKVHGETSAPGQAITEQMPVAPADGYSKSKWAAEEEIIRICESTGMEYVILRPPLVYGPGVGANFLTLLKAVAGRYPLPLGGIDNLRSLIYVENLADVIAGLIAPPAARNQVYLVKDTDISTPELVRALSRALGLAPRLYNWPPALLKVVAGILNRGEKADRLTESMCIDDTKLRAAINWSPPVDSRTAFERTAAWFLSTRRGG